jgi:hypothetical protein
MRRRRIRLLHELSKSVFWSLRSTTSNRGGALNGWIEEVGGGKLGALGIGSICGQSRVGKKSTRSHKAEETAKLSEMPS